VLVAAAAADHFGSSLAAGFKGLLPFLFLPLALFLLWLPLDSINEQLRIRIAAVYIERQLRPQILTEAGPASHDFLTWEPFQADIMLTLRASRIFIAGMLGLRAFVSYAPAIAALLYFLLSGTGWNVSGWDLILRIALLALWTVVALVPLVGAIYLATSKKLKLGP